MKVAILGAGPAGLMTAYACERNGLEPVIYTASLTRSEIPTDMYLQRPLPGMVDNTLPDAELHYMRWGTPEEYARKVYGSPDAPVSWDNIEWGQGKLWWLKELYDRLWLRYLSEMKELEITPALVPQIAATHAVVLSTLPAPIICDTPGHQFESVDTWLARYITDATAYTMIYSGQPFDHWFRSSRLRGWLTFEYAKIPPPIELGADPTLLNGKKLLGNTCTCHPTVLRIGRWAQWQRGILNHHAFEQATAVLASLGLGKGA